MPIRLPLLLAALSLALLVPAAARAADYVPDEVIVRYEAGTGGGVAAQVAAEAGTEPVQALPGGSEQLAIDDGDSVRETIAELRKDPNVAYAVPNWRAHAAADGAERPGVPPPVELLRRATASTWSRRGRSRRASARRAARGALVAVLDSGVAFERYGRYRRAPDLRRSTFVRPWDFIGRTATRTTCTATARTWPARSRRRRTTARHGRHRLQREDHAAAGARLVRRGRLR